MSQSLESRVLAHRYLYYVLMQPIISDYDYDMLERTLPEDSEVRQSVGSDCASSYAPEIVALAKQMLAERKTL